MKRSDHKQAWYIINGITIYRIAAAPFLLWLLFTGKYDVFRWLLAVSFFTDLIDGFLARKYKVSSILGARLDSIGDDLTVLVAVIGLFITEMTFIKEKIGFFIVLFALFLIQTSYALIRYKKLTNFHTYLAKTAALLQGVFLLYSFFFGGPNLILFYAAVVITGLELLEEIMLVRILKNWEANVKGIYWVMNRKRNH